MHQWKGSQYLYIHNITIIIYIIINYIIIIIMLVAEVEKAMDNILFAIEKQENQYNIIQL